MATLQRIAREYLLALQFFTRLPVTGPLAEWVGFSPEMLRASAAHFPGVGWIVGLAACAVFALASIALPDGAATPLAAAVLCTIATVLLTGAFHEDGLADLADGLGGSAERERALAIMKDPRIGSYGTLALVLGVGAKVSLLAVLAGASPAAVLAALLGGHVVSRFWPLLIIATLPHIGAPGDSKSKPLADRIEARAVWTGAAWCVVPMGIVAAVQGPLFLLGALAASGAAAGWVRRLLRRRLGGFTGDGLGAAQQAGEAAFYLGAAIALA
jgi:adenosylcobinamide-GDP ribazoletransferase